MNTPYVMKKCSKCGRWLVASTVNFYRNKDGRYGLTSRCKECKNKENNQWREDNKEKEAERKKQWRQANPEYNKQYGKQWRQANPEYNKQYRKTNKKKLFEQQKQWREANPEYNKQYYQDNKKKVLERHKQYRQSPQGQAMRFNASNKRRHKKAAQGTGVTPDQWLEMMQYFDFRCAYTGERLTKKTRSVDHIVPIDTGGDDMVWNMVPMLRNLNSSKCAKDMLEWYKSKDFYDPKKLAKIYEWQEYAYNKYGKDTEYFNTNDIQIKLI